jgi:hypothetical protein
MDNRYDPPLPDPACCGDIFTLMTLWCALAVSRYRRRRYGCYAN